MFCVIEYTDYMKDQLINIHSYFHDKDNAISYAKNQAEKIIEKIGGYVKESNSYNTTYVTLENKKVCEFRTFDIEELLDIDVIRYKNNAIKYNKNLYDFIDDCINIKFYGFPLKYESIKNKMISEFTIQEIKEILTFLTINYENSNFGPNIFINSSAVFAVVELKKIDDK